MRGRHGLGHDRLVHVAALTLGPARRAQHPPVMYSQPWSPTPSATAVAPELRTQNRSPTTPHRNTSPAVAPYKTTFPAMMFSAAANGAAGSGAATIRPPDRPLPR